MANILVVDDEKQIAQGIERSLRQKAHQVRVAYDGAAALAAARQNRPDLIILDIIMPGMDGIQVCREMRNDDRLQRVPIIFLTSASQIEDRIRGLEAGGDDYLNKPFHLQELLLRIEAILRRTKGPKKDGDLSLLTVGQLQLNCRTYQLRVAGEKTVNLTPVEFDLLYHLMSHPGDVFNADRLLGELWPAKRESRVDLVRMHIRNLRLKIESDPRRPRHILTVPRQGYTIAQK